MPPTLFLFLTALLVPLPVSWTAMAANNAGSIPYLAPIEANVSPEFLSTPLKLLFSLAPLAVAVELITPPMIVPLHHRAFEFHL